MAEERDAKVSAAYRALGTEEPPRALDEAILGAARHAAQPWTRRWAVPLSLAAVVVLSVTVTLRVQHEQPGIEMPAPVKKEVAQEKRPAAAEPQAAAPAKAAADLAVRAPQQKPSSRAEADGFPGTSRDRAAAENRAPATTPAPLPAPAPATRSQAGDALAKRADADASSVAGSAAGSVAAPPAPAAAAPAMRALQRERVAAERMEAQRPVLSLEQELERIADLRKEQKHDEADKALAEFRKRFPEFKIPSPMLERVERR